MKKNRLFHACKEIERISTINRKAMKSLICPVSYERVDENRVRITALFTVLFAGLFMIIPNPVIPLYLAVDFYIRAFTKLKVSPLSWLSGILLSIFKPKPILIDKAPKIFAARIGFVFSLAMSIFILFGLINAAMIATAVLVLFATLECGLNFCAGCWAYSYLVHPFYKDK